MSRSSRPGATHAGSEKSAPFSWFRNVTGLNSSGNAEDAATARAIGTLDPDLPDAHYFRGEALRLMGDIAEAIRAYDQSVNTDPDYAPAYLGRGRALLLRNTDAALNDLDRALRLDPSMTEAYLELGAYYSSNKLWLVLETSMEAALEDGVITPMIYIRLSEAQTSLGKSQEALENALEGSANDPTLLLGYLAVGRAYVAVGVDNLIQTTTLLLYGPSKLTSSTHPTITVV